MTASLLQSKQGKTLLLFLTVWATTTWLAYYAAHFQANDSLIRNLQYPHAKSLAIKLSNSGLLRAIEPDFESKLIQQIDGTLQALTSRSGFSVVEECSVRLLAVNDHHYNHLLSEERLIALPAQEVDRLTTPSLQLASRCSTRWTTLLASYFLLSIVVTFFLRLLPRPLPNQAQPLFQRLLTQGLSAKQAKPLSRKLSDLAFGSTLLERLSQLATTPTQLWQWLEHPQLCCLTESQLDWLIIALQRDSTMDQAVEIAQSTADLILISNQCRVICHGLEINLPATPFYYFYWYAQQRQLESDGWFTNPPANRPDTQSGQSLLALMEANQGNGKAVKELREKGLRSKVLDQNRSKIRDELHSVLGEQLAAEYLFESERDPRTARYRHRLAIAPEQIQLK